MTERFICIHGHFYQPPRENAWLDAVELQDSAYPYHDWNERITAECYAPNASSRILDSQDQIVKIVNNYAGISFDFGPTLLSWLERCAPETYSAVIDADRASREKFGGHGSAMAQAYNHIILPLANERDKRTQIVWGIRDFQLRFERFPEGMWLPETAVDLESLEILAQEGILFTVLEPHQAARVRRIGEDKWSEISGGRIDPSMPYKVHLPSGRSIAVFFYDGPISRAVAFENLLSRGELFADRLTSAFSSHRERAQLVHIATDGETYGHHHRKGDMALAYALHTIETQSLARLTNYGEFLELHPPTYEVDVVPLTSWSCIHGVERWRSDCGCRTGGEGSWNQQWRGPLRSALDWLRDELIPVFEQRAADLLRSPWAARDAYADVILNRSDSAIQNFMRAQASRELSPGEIVRCLMLLEMQRHSMLMFTSCGWFFNELSGIETIQVLQYAARALQLASDLGAHGLDEGFRSRLERAESNLHEQGNGAKIFERSVMPAMVDMQRVGAHHAVTSLFEIPKPTETVYGYEVTTRDFSQFEIGRSKVALGRVEVVSEITRETVDLTFGVLYLGDIHLTGGLRIDRGEDAYRELYKELSQTMSAAEFPPIMRLLDKHLGDRPVSFKSLFHDEQRKILNVICDATFAEAEAAFRQLHDRYLPLMRLHTDLGIPLPRALNVAAEFDLNLQLKRAFEREELPIGLIESLLRKARSETVTLDDPSLSYTLKKNIERLVDRFLTQPDSIEILRRLEAVATLVRQLPFDVDLWKMQNAYYRMRQLMVPDFDSLAQQGDASAREWLDGFGRLGVRLSMRLD